MAVHDPDSEMHKLSQELKEGRQKRIQIIDGQEVVTHVKAEEETEDEEDESMDMEHEEQVRSLRLLNHLLRTQTNFHVTSQVVAIEGEDGQQYVVLEVIQMQNQEAEAATTNDADLMGEDFLLNDGTFAAFHSTYQ